jgi:PilZ domain
MSSDEKAIDKSERRGEPRTETAFFAVEIRGTDLYYRLVRNISASGFSFDDRFPLERPGDPILMEFPLPGSRDPIRVTGRVVYARPDRGVGVHIEDVERDRYERLMSVPPPTRWKSAANGK